MFTEIIGKAGDKRYEDRVHPNYQEIVSRLSPDEAKILEILYYQQYKVEVSLKSIVDYRNKTSINVTPIAPNQDLQKRLSIQADGIPFMEVREALKGSSNAFGVVYKVFTDINQLGLRKNEKDIELCFDTLESLSLIEIDRVGFFLNQETYHHLINHQKIQKLQQESQTRGNIVRTKKGRIVLTELGKQFLDVVFRGKNGIIKS